MSKVILYHHSSVAETRDFIYRDYANLIYLADRVDIAIVRGATEQELFTMVNRPCFRKEHLEALHTALRTTELYSAVVSGTFKERLHQALSSLRITPEEATTYLRMLVYAIDFKSQHTVLHSINTTSVSVFLARQLGFDAQRVQKIYFAALIHDLGKMATPQHILEFPGRLNPEQMAIMRQHVCHTRDLLENLLPQDICHSAVRHHEKLDGSGYPLGLTAKTLTTDDRIVAIADIFSALVSARSYKEKFGRERTLSILEDMVSKGLIDGDIVALLREHFEEVHALLCKNQQPLLQRYQNIQQEFCELMRGEDEPKRP